MPSRAPECQLHGPMCPRHQPIQLQLLQNRHFLSPEFLLHLQVLSQLQQLLLQGLQFWNQTPQCRLSTLASASPSALTLVEQSSMSSIPLAIGFVSSPLANAEMAKRPATRAACIVLGNWTVRHLLMAGALE